MLCARCLLCLGIHCAQWLSFSDIHCARCLLFCCSLLVSVSDIRCARCLLFCCSLLVSVHGQHGLSRVFFGFLAHLIVCLAFCLFLRIGPFLPLRFHNHWDWIHNHRHFISSPPPM